MDNDRTNLDILQSRTVDWLRYPLMVLIVFYHTDTSLLLSMPLNGVSSVLYQILRTLMHVAVPLFFFLRILVFPPTGTLYKESLP